MTSSAKHVQPHLFDPPPAAYARLSVTLTGHLDGPTGWLEVWTTITDTTTGEQLACWSQPADSIFRAPECFAELAGDAMRAALRDLAPF